MRRADHRASLAALALTLASGTGAAPPDAAGDPPSEPLATTAAPAYRPRLLREGQYLVELIGRVQRDPTGRWVARAEDRRGQAIELILLPCSFLEPLDALHGALAETREQPVDLEVTGLILVYGDQNYLLPTRPPRVPRSAIAAAPPLEPAVDPGEPPEADGDEPRAGDRATAILDALERETGPLTPPPAPEIEAEREAPLPEHELITWRRGRLGRDAGGAWVLVFESDARGLADPPMILMPCTLLERMTAQADRDRMRPPVLLSGRVFAFRGRNYLLPTAYRIPRERTVLEN